MDLGETDKVRPLIKAVREIVNDEIAPMETEFQGEVGRSGERFIFTSRMTEILEGLKTKAYERGLWNFWLTDSNQGYGLSTVEYAYLAEEMKTQFMQRSSTALLQTQAIWRCCCDMVLNPSRNVG